MAIVTGWCNSAKPQFFNGDHLLKSVGSGGHTFNVALYTNLADLGPTDTVYKVDNEVVATGYTAGGAVLVVQDPIEQNGKGICTPNNVVFAASTITAAGCLMYNTSFGNAALSTHSFGGDVSSVNGDFTLIMPAFTSDTALWRMA